VKSYSEIVDEERAKLTEIYLKGAKSGCLPKLNRNPIQVEPHLKGSSSPRYNRNTEDIVVLKVSPSPLDSITPESSENFLERLQGIKEPISFEIIGSSAGITVQIIMQKRDRRIVESAFDAICGHSYLKQTPDVLLTSYKKITSKTGKGSPNNMEFQFNDYYLRPPYFFPIHTPQRDFSRDTVDPVISMFSKLRPNELGVYQAIFIPANKRDWGHIPQKLLSMRIQEHLYDNKETHPVLSDESLKDHTAKALEKTRDRKPFFAVSLRMGIFGYKKSTPGILKALTNTLNVLVPGNTSFQFLTRKDYYAAAIPEKLHYYIFFNRVSLREGMLLTSKELSGLVHFPTEQSLKKDYPIDIARGKRPVPDFVTTKKAKGIVIGDSPYKGEQTTVVLEHKLRAQHCHIIGKTGFGKSTLIENCVIQDIKQGTGVCLIDPHGELIENHVVPKIPPECMDNVIYFDPIRTPLPINILEAKGREERLVIADDVVSIFKRYTDSWGVQIEEILGFGVQAILSSKEGGHLGTLRNFLLDPKERKRYLETIEDEFVLEFWRDQFPSFLNPKVAMITATRRLNQLLRSPVLRDILTKKESVFNFRDVMDNGKILLINIPIGKLGAINAYILGSLIIARLQAAALTRQDIPEEQRKPFYLYVDEFHHFLCQSIEESLTGTRKYALGLILAHHSLGQIATRDKAVADAVLDVPNTRICFQLGDNDAIVLGKGFSNYTPEDLKNLKRGETIMRVGGSSNDFELNTRYEPVSVETSAPQIRERLIRQTQERYGLDARQYEATDNIEGDFSPQASGDTQTYTQKDSTPLGPNKAPSNYQGTQGTGEDGIGKIDFEPEEKSFLEFLASLTRLLPVRDYKGNKLKNRLLARGVISEADMDLGKAKGKSNILALSRRGYEALGLPVLTGKGGPLHQFIQKIIAQHAEGKGYESTIEAESVNETQVDIGLLKEGKKVAVEVSVTTRPEQIVRNIDLAFRGGYDEVISLFTLSETLANTKKLIRETLPEERRKKITLKLASEYESEI